MSQTGCALCGTQSEYSSTFGAFHTPFYKCPQCGEYVLGELFASNWKGNKDNRAFKIACLTREYQLAEKKILFGIFEDVFEPSTTTVDRHLKRWWRIGELLAEFPKPTQIIDKALLNLSRTISYPFEMIDCPWGQCEYLVYSPQQSACTLIKFMEANGLLGKTTTSSGGIYTAISPAGWQHIESLSKAGKDSRQAFVAMWFDERVHSLYQNGIKPAIEAAGFECRRIDTVEHNNKICDEIIAEIRKSRFVVADFTGHRGGVYFEAGYAAGMGLPVIWIVRKDDVDKLHFDTRQYNHIVYEAADDLKQSLHNRIAVTIH